MILGEIEARAAEEARRLQDEQRARADREAHWRAARDMARQQAVCEQLGQVLREEAGRWQEAAALSAYCMALEWGIGELDGAADESALVSARLWLEWAREYVKSVDPLSGLPGMPQTREPSLKEPKPLRKGWDPQGTEWHG